MTTTSLPQSLDNTRDTPGVRAPLVLGDNDFASVTEKVCRIIELPVNETPKMWYVLFGISASLVGMLGCMVAYLFYNVFWVGIGHAGTLISAILYLFRQTWRTAINRSAEAMTIFAVICALLFPGIHIGRVWLAFWLFPIPDQQLWMWPNFRSPLLWDVFAVGTYFTVSLLFWYMGLIPDLATVRDRAVNKVRETLYGLFALGWRGSNRHWQRYERAYLCLAA
ncbi:MAG: NrfD/PsrC family molybdoenzyme membrane anchor subunit, partial [Planctomycetota bacterium]